MQEYSPTKLIHYPTTDVLTLRDQSRGLETPVHVTENGPLWDISPKLTPKRRDYYLTGLDVRLASVWFNAIAEDFNSGP